MPKLYLDTDAIWKFSAADLLFEMGTYLSPERDWWRLDEIEEQLCDPNHSTSDAYTADTARRAESCLASIKIQPMTVAMIQGPFQPHPGQDYEFLLINQMLVEKDSLFLTHDKTALRSIANITGVDFQPLAGRIACLEAAMLGMHEMYGADLVSFWCAEMPQTTYFRDYPRNSNAFLDRLRDDFFELQNNCNKIRLWHPEKR